VAIINLGEMELRFAELIWVNAPVSSRELTEICAREFEWKRTTTYTMLRRLCDKGFFQNIKGTVSTVKSRDDFMAEQGEKFIEDTFDGSLPNFLVSFTRRKSLSEKEIIALQKLIDEHKEA
jgi:BlaI family transcriptional regulator, penicillinase repressor